MKCCETCRWHEDYENSCVCADSEHCAERVTADTVCDEWTAIEHFTDAWNSTLKPADRALYGWDANPWVWVIEFEQVSREEAIQNG